MVTEISSATLDGTALIELQSPPGVNFDLFVRCASCGGALVGQSTLGAGMTDTVQFRTTDFNGNNDRALYIEVRYISANACAPLWRLKVTGGAVVTVSPSC